MTNEEDLVYWLDSVGTCSCCNNERECYGNKTEYELIQEAIEKIKQLRSEVERLRLTSQEMELIRLGVHRLKEVEDCELGTDIEDIAARLRGGE